MGTGAPRPESEDAETQKIVTTPSAGPVFPNLPDFKRSQKSGNFFFFLNGKSTVVFFFLFFFSPKRWH